MVWLHIVYLVPSHLWLLLSGVLLLNYYPMQCQYCDSRYWFLSFQALKNVAAVCFSHQQGSQVRSVQLLYCDSHSYARNTQSYLSHFEPGRLVISWQKTVAMLSFLLRLLRTARIVIAEREIERFLLKQQACRFKQLCFIQAFYILKHLDISLAINSQ